MPIPTTSLATDEELILRCGTVDFDALRIRDQAVVSGRDGAFAPSDRWTLTSAADFAAQGVEAGMVARVDLPGQGAVSSVQFFAVEAAAPGALTLRRLGAAAGSGQPPSPGGTVGPLVFIVNTLKPQALRATQDLEARWGVDDAVAGRRFADLYDPAALRDACVLTVLWKLCQAEATTGSPAAKEGASAAWFAKAAAYKSELDEVLARLVVRFNDATAAGLARTQSVTRFGMRISR
jgi:hypothetical protein